MITMTALDAIVEEIRTLPPGKLSEAANFIHQLKVRSESERRLALDRAYGCLSESEAADLETAIQANCERIDARQW